VALLSSKGIIQNAIGSDKAVAKLFNSISKDMVLEPESALEIVHREVNAYCWKPWNMWRANLIHTYFQSPWAFLSLAFSLLVMTIMQTVYTVMQYYQGGSSDGGRSLQCGFCLVVWLHLCPLQSTCVGVNSDGKLIYLNRCGLR
jgi:hypothetical protein